MDALRRKIDEAKSLNALNSLRAEVISEIKQDPALLKYWQDRYWGMRTCRTCGHDLVKSGERCSR